MSKEVDTGVNLYEFNKINMAQIPCLETTEQFNGAKLVVKDFVNENLSSNYYMLLNHEKRYFTVFHISKEIDLEFAKEMIANDILECMLNCNFGIIDINKDESEMALEVWVKDLETADVHMFLFFPYDFGVIEY